MFRLMKFYFFLSVRLQVFVISFLIAAHFGHASVRTIFALIKDENHINTTLPFNAQITVVAIVSFPAIFAIWGLIGALVKSRRLVSFYSTVFKLHLALSIGNAIFWIIKSFREDQQEFFLRCINTSTHENPLDICNKSATFRFNSNGRIVACLMVELYCCIIVSRYVVQLQEEADDKYHHLLAPSPKMAAVSSTLVHALGVKEMETNAPLGGAPYTDAAQSHGNTSG